MRNQERNLTVRKAHQGRDKSGEVDCGWNLLLLRSPLSSTDSERDQHHRNQQRTEITWEATRLTNGNFLLWWWRDSLEWWLGF